jgi:hypothetical protein
MKIEKMGEKKEWFLEKLGECYSISTKNGSLSLNFFLNFLESDNIIKKYDM